MTPDEFVAALSETVFRPAVDGVLEQAAAPSGRQPSSALVALSAWYRALPPEGRAAAAQLVRHGAHAALFGLLALLDGVRACDAAGGHLELTYVSADGTRALLAPPMGAMLHDLFQAAVYDDTFGPTAA